MTHFYAGMALGFLAALGCCVARPPYPLPEPGIVEVIACPREAGRDASPAEEPREHHYNETRDPTPRWTDDGCSPLQVCLDGTCPWGWCVAGCCYPYEGEHARRTNAWGVPERQITLPEPPSPAP